MEGAAAIVRRNAQRLIRDAKTLADVGSYRTATSLTVLAIEECGKACLVHWAELGLVERNKLSILASHLDKQKMLLAFSATEGLFNGAADIVSSMNAPAFRALVDGSLTPDEDFIEKIAHSMWKHSQAYEVLINSSVISYAKNDGFYEDVSDTLQVERVITCDEGWYGMLLLIAEEAWKMTGASLIGHRVMATIYLELAGRAASKRPNRSDVLRMIRTANEVVARHCTNEKKADLS